MMIKIRRANAADAHQLAPIMLLAMREIVYYFIGEENETKALEFLRHFIALPDNQYSFEHIWIAESDHGDILGQACLYDGAELHRLRAPVLEYIEQQYQHSPIVANETAAGEIYLDTLAVAPNARGLGVGTLLLQHSIDTYVKRGNATLGLLVDEQNPKAKSLYLRTGFSIISEITLFGNRLTHLQIAPQSAAL